jgi:periplasmic divalent cation tolerance protein
MTDKRIVLTTTGSEEEARKIARVLVERRLAACVNIIPQIESIYRWQGKIEESREWLLLIKTSVELFPAVSDAIRELHSYDLPECITVNITDGSAEYLQWLGDSIKDHPIEEHPIKDDPIEESGSSNKNK